MPDPGRPDPDTEEPDDMPWVRLDDSLFTDDPTFAVLDDRLKVAYLAAVTFGARMSPPGTWRDLDHARMTLPVYVADAFPDLIAAGALAFGDVIRVVRESFYLADTPAAVRQRRYRERNALRNGVVSSRLGEHSSPSIPSPPTVPPAPDPEAPLTDDWYRTALLVEELTQQPYALGDPWSRLGERVRRMLDKHGGDRLADAMRRAATAAGPMPTSAQVILGAGNILDAIPRADPDCPTCLNTGTTAAGGRCTDCRRSGNWRTN